MRPSDRAYTKEHEWVLTEGDEVTVGITDYASEELGDIVYLDLPEEGSTVTAGESMGSIETVKAVEEIYAPVSGEVIAVNAALADQPELVNASPFEDGWMVKIRTEGETVETMSVDEYDRMVSGS
jgi:glycine cleavage system H protein